VTPLTVRQALEIQSADLEWTPPADPPGNNGRTGQSGERDEGPTDSWEKSAKKSVIALRPPPPKKRRSGGGASYFEAGTQLRNSACRVLKGGGSRMTARSGRVARWGSAGWQQARHKAGAPETQPQGDWGKFEQHNKLRKQAFPHGRPRP